MQLSVPSRTYLTGVIPYRLTDHQVEVLLITSRTRKRWIIPKGHVEPHLSARESASLEAYEEAGVKGFVNPVPFGYYEQDGTGLAIEVYLMRVETVLRRWPEAHERRRRWMTLQEAFDAVQEPGLRLLFTEMAELMH